MSGGRTSRPASLRLASSAGVEAGEALPAGETGSGRTVLGRGGGEERRSRELWEEWRVAVREGTGGGEAMREAASISARKPPGRAPGMPLGLGERGGDCV